CTMLLVPNSSYVYEDYLPPYAFSYDQGEVLAYMHANVSDNLNFVDCGNKLIENKDDYIFYRTDHHWTMNGAYIGYTCLCDALGIQATPKSEYEIEIGSDSFYGTLYSKAPTFTQKKDSIILYHNPRGEYTVEYYDTKETADSLYNYENLQIKDKYTTYLDGNHPYIKITSNAVSCEEESCNHKLIVVKDSYAHCLLPLLADNYSEIYVLDMRYFHNSVSLLAEEEGITDVVFINNLDFISTDNNFLWLK
ncbi:MAG: DHHW family protein, partial [Wujia sp.]